MTTQPTTCRYCEKQFDAEVIPVLGGATLVLDLCSDDCQQAHIAQHEASELTMQQSEALDRFRDIVPVDMHTVDYDAYPNMHIIAKYTDWEPIDGKGLIVQGSTGLGKTRLAYQIIKHLMTTKGFSVKIFETGDFAAASQGAWTTGGSEKWYAAMMKYDLLFFDDIDKMKLTEPRENDLFSIVNKRKDRKLPMMITTNCTIQELGRKFTNPDTALPFVRRMEECCDRIILQ